MYKMEEEHKQKMAQLKAEHETQMNEMNNIHKQIKAATAANEFNKVHELFKELMSKMKA